MSIETTWFFYVFLGGFITVWTFRYFSGRKTVYAEFEWLGLSAFWGINVITLLNQLPQPQEQFLKLLGNPLATALVTSLLGAAVGYCGSRLVGLKTFKYVTSFLGKGSRDKSGDIF